MAAAPVFFARAIRPFKALFVSDAFAGILLIFVAAAAMIVANTGLSHAYHELFHGRLAWTPIPKLDTLHLWINDGLMAIFFFVVGLEVKRELIAGSLADPRARRLPVLAAAAGMAAPAAIFLFLVGGNANLHSGWAIPAATDIAFAMGVVGLLGTRVPGPLRLFLLTVAIVDDIGAVAIIALAYTPNIKLVWLIASLVVLAVMIGMNRAHVSRIAPYILAALVLWVCVLFSGVHATIAGVVAALTIPMKRRDGRSMLENIEHALVGWNAYLVVPVFGFANAGVDIRELGLDALLDPLPLAVAAGLVAGKQLGIFSAVYAADRVGFARKPDGCNWVEMWGVTILCGIGFTMSLFISGLAFPGFPVLVEEAKIGILLGSLISALLGYGVLRLTTTHPEMANPQAG
ncbi:Na+/H+ antiporter NhaA [Alteriqipengyuania flavescens]|uniref:Na+/H+ antiporter NhaA n=1 Tax=Alteriqipengyuania flavescens TaxID=3053610 RepID=UPI0025B31302|nr:Na+/H+ antiporter NhaA [Alteriqipengyuania flavescens]WJY19161.1 Na+/H+ antiporter NhaA [Alteriqipengyuania flavescens]WJY25101.1 Na+/H+ antiporter NhaA [Alteriqipengyuania flavescens]